MLNILLPVIFAIGIILIALEEKIKINKAAIAVGMSILMWSLVLFDVENVFDRIVEGGLSKIPKELVEYAHLEGTLLLEARDKIIEIILMDKLGEVATTLFFVMSVMVIIELIDSNGGFESITKNIVTRNKRKLLWIVSFLSFFTAAVLDDIAAAIVVVALLRKLIEDRDDRLIFACVTVIAANAGGSWSPLGDVTTIMLWSSGNVSALHQITSLFIPALVSLVITILIAQRYFPKGTSFPALEAPRHKVNKKYELYGQMILGIGVLSLICVPVFTELTGLPPYMGVLGGLALLWCFTDIVLGRIKSKEVKKHNVVNMFGRIDMATIMFFYGVLMSVAAIDVAGILEVMGIYISEAISEPLLISFIIGICSSVLDNVALVAATMGMYPLSEPDSLGFMASFVADSDFWTFLAFCGVTGGSILIIGSATGVTIMGMERVQFSYYLKKFSLIAFLAYVGGGATYLLLNVIF